MPPSPGEEQRLSLTVQMREYSRTKMKVIGLFSRQKLLEVMRVLKLYYLTHVLKLTSMANLHQSKSISVVRMNSCDKAVGT